jgi:hypothetical protein
MVTVVYFAYSLSTFVRNLSRDPQATRSRLLEIHLINSTSSKRDVFIVLQLNNGYNRYDSKLKSIEKGRDVVMANFSKNSKCHP